MRDYAVLYSKILERENFLLQNYIASNRTAFREHFTETSRFIDTVPLSEKQKEVLRSIMEYHRVLIEGSLENLTDMSRLCNKAMRQRFSRLLVQEQEEAISTYRESELFVIQGGQQ